MTICDCSCNNRTQNALFLAQNVCSIGLQYVRLKIDVVDSDVCLFIGRKSSSPTSRSRFAQFKFKHMQRATECKAARRVGVWLVQFLLFTATAA